MKMTFGRKTDIRFAPKTKLDFPPSEEQQAEGLTV